MPLFQGQARWARIVGAPQPDYNKTGNEWSIEIDVDDEGVHTLEKQGVSPVYIKEREDGTRFVRFVRRALNQSGNPSKPIRIVDHHGEDWPEDQLIGNGSVVNVKYALNDVTIGKNRGAKKPGIIAVQVWDWKKYNSDFPKAERTADNNNQDNEAWDEE